MAHTAQAFLLLLLQTHPAGSGAALRCGVTRSYGGCDMRTKPLMKVSKRYGFCHWYCGTHTAQQISNWAAEHRSLHTVERSVFGSVEFDHGRP